MRGKVVAVLALILCTGSVWAKAEKVHLQKVAEGYTLQFEVPQYQFDEVNKLGLRNTPGSTTEAYSRIKVSDYKRTDELGKPELPYYVFHMAIPRIDQLPTFEIQRPLEESVTPPHVIFPAQTPWLKSQTASQRTFDMDEQYYASQGEDQALATVDDVFTIRGVPCVRIKVSPFSYNPLENKLTITRNFTLKIKISTTEKFKGLDSKPFEKYLRYIVVNFDDAVEPVNKTEKEDYHIITPPEYEAGLEEFINFRKIRFNVEVSTTDQTGTSSSDITSYIKALDPTPAFLLLVGDEDKIPFYSGGTRGVTDLGYSSTTGDYHPEILLGRFSVTSSAELGNIIRKTIFMESNLGTIPMKNVFTGGEDASNGYIAEETHDYVIDTYLDTAGYENVKLYCNSESISEEDFTSVLKEGVIFNIYSGHGMGTSWSPGDFSFSAGDYKGLDNTASYPFSYGFACETGNIGSAECFTEAAIRGVNGAVTCVGASISTGWGQDDDMERGLFDGLFDPDNPQTTVSASLNAGKELCGSESYWEAYNLMGDPGLELFPVDLAPFVTVISPFGGEEWEQGRSFDITWDDNFDDNVKIELLKGGSVEEELAASVPSEGSYTWDIGDDFPLGTDYKIRITCVVQDTLVDESDSAFSIEVKSNLALKTPNGGEYIEKESEVEITWDDNLSGDVNIDLFRAGEFYVNIASSVQSNGSYTWKVSETIKSGSEYRIRVVGNDKDWLYDESDTDLAIQNPSIKTFPYAQNFDGFTNNTTTMRDYWEQLDDDDLEWTVLKGKTPSKEEDQGAATGPSNDHTSGSGNYVYVESSGSNNPSKKANFITPVFDLSTLKEGTCSFWYHMFSDNEGADEMGDLYVDMSVNGKWEEGVVHYDGDKGDQWNQETIDLKDNSGQKLQFRFRAVTGSGWASDIAIDDFEIQGKANAVPQFTSIPDTAAVADKEYACNITAEDSNGEDVSFVGKTVPAWLTFKDNGDGTAELKGTPRKDDEGYHEVVIGASDGIIADPIEQAYKIEVTIITPIVIDLEDVNLARFKIGPNPADQQTEAMRFEFPFENVREAQLTVYDAVGNQVYDTQLADGVAVWDLPAYKRIGKGTYLAILWVTYNDSTIEQLKKPVGVK